MTVIQDLQVATSAVNALAAAYIAVAPTSFTPEYYAAKSGVVCSPTVDCVPYMQAAIDAAGAAGGGDVWFDGDYGGKPVLDADGFASVTCLNQYWKRYCLINRFNNVRIHARGTFTLLSLPPMSRPQYGFPTGVKAFEVIVIGYGTPAVTSIASMPVLYNVGLYGGRRINGVITNGMRFKLDPSISSVDLEVMKGSSISGWVSVCNCKNWEVSGCVFEDSWGHTGAITPHVCSEKGRIESLDITGRWTPGANGSWTSCCECGVEGDGLRDSFIRDVICNYCYHVVGINANADNRQAPSDIQIVGCKSAAFSGAAVFSTGMSGLMLRDCDFSTARGGPSLATIIASERAEDGGVTPYPTRDCAIINNKIAYTGPGTVKSGIGVIIRSKGLPNPNENCWQTITGNQMIRMATPITLDSPLCHDIYTQGNDYGGAGAVQYNGGALESANRIQAS